MHMLVPASYGDGVDSFIIKCKEFRIRPGTYYYELRLYYYSVLSENL